MTEKIKELSWFAPIWKLICKIKPSMVSKKEFDKKPANGSYINIGYIKDSQVLIVPVVICVNVTQEDNTIDIT